MPTLAKISTYKPIRIHYTQDFTETNIFHIQSKILFSLLHHHDFPDIKDVRGNMLTNTLCMWVCIYKHSQTFRSKWHKLSSFHNL